MLNSYSVVCFTLLQFPKNVKCISLHIVYGWSVSKDCMVILLSSRWKKFNHLVGYWLKTELINVKVKEKVMVTFCKNYSFFDVLAYFHNKWITHKLKLIVYSLLRWNKSWWIFVFDGSGFQECHSRWFAFYKKTVNGIQHLGGAFEHNFGPGGPEFKQTNLHSWKFSRVRDVKLWIDWHIMWKW